MNPFFLAHWWGAGVLTFSCVFPCLRGLENSLRNLFYKDTDPINEGSTLMTYSPPKCLPLNVIPSINL